MPRDIERDLTPVIRSGGAPALLTLLTTPVPVMIETVLTMIKAIRATAGVT